MAGAWTDCLQTGWEPFDREHADLVDRLGLLLSAVNAGETSRARAMLDEFVRSCGEHFAHEERLMALNAYGLLARHKEAHDLFLADVGEHVAELAACGITPTFRRWVAGRVAEWFRFHVSANDVALGVFLAARRRSCQLRDEERPVRRDAARRRNAT